MKNTPEKDLEEKLFNDIVRGVIKREVVDKINGMKTYLITYMVATFINFLFDVIDFLYLLSQVDKDDYTNNYKVIFLSYLIIALLYIAVDFSYIFWTNSLKYTFPYIYLEPIYDTFTGTVTKLIRRFKIGKKETDIKEEARQKAAEGNKEEGVNNNQIQLQIDIDNNMNNKVYRNKNEEMLDK